MEFKGSLSSLQESTVGLLCGLTGDTTEAGFVMLLPCLQAEDNIYDSANECKVFFISFSKHYVMKMFGLCSEEDSLNVNVQDQVISQIILGSWLWEHSSSFANFTGEFKILCATS